MLDARVRRSHWLITKYDHSKMNALTLCFDGEGEALAVFGFEEEAEMFLHFRYVALEGGWKVRQTSVGELVSMLYGPCSNAKKVVLDPLPGVVGGEGLTGFLSMRRSDFLRILLGEEPSGLHFAPSQPRKSQVKLERGHVA